MNAYNEIDGMPCAADRELLTGAPARPLGLRRIGRLRLLRGAADSRRTTGSPADAQDAAATALDAGIDVELPSTDCYGAPLLEARRSRPRRRTTTLDEAVRRVLATKFELGLFERAVRRRRAAVADAIGMDAQRALARTIARKSLVLLKNDGALPLAAEAQRIAVIGPNADELRHLFGDYCYPAHVESLREMLEGGGNVFSIDAPDGSSSSTDDARGADDRSTRCARASATRVRFARGLRRQHASRATASTRPSRWPRRRTSRSW